MTEAREALRADVLARLLLIQTGAGRLPDDSAIVEFVCRGLTMVPGVAEAWHLAQDRPASDGNGHQAGLQGFPVRLGSHSHGEIVLRLAGSDLFLPYAPHVNNLVNMVAVMLEERRQRQLGERHERALEARVAERTRELSAEVLVRQAAEAAALAEKRRAERYLEVTEAIIVETDSEGRVTLINKRGSDLLGWAPAELLGRDWSPLAVAAEGPLAAHSGFAAEERGEVATLGYHDSDVLTRSGERRHIAWHTTTRRDDEGKLIGHLSSGQDMTDRKPRGRKRACAAAWMASSNKLRSANALLQSEIAQRQRATEELERREAELREAQRIAGIGSWTH